MVCLSTIFMTGAVLLAAAVNALPANVHIGARQVDDGSICGVEATAGIRSPANGSTITFTAAEQADYEWHTFEVIYCSGQYFKTSSLYVDTWIANTDSYSSGAGQFYGRAIGLNTEPDNTGDVAPAGFYGYRYNVSVGPISGNYELGPKLLTVLEVQSGYYNPNNVEAHSVQIEFTAEPTS